MKSGPSLFGDVEPHVHTHDQRNYWTSGGGSGADPTFLGAPGPSSYASCGEVTSENFQAAMGCQSPTGSSISGQTHHTHGSNSSNAVNESINFDSKAEGTHLYMYN